MPAGQSLLVPFGLCSVLPCPSTSPQPCFTKCPIFPPSPAATVAHFLLTVSAEHLPDTEVLSVASGSAVVRCLTSQPGSEKDGGGSSLQDFQLPQGSSFRGLNSVPTWGSACREAIHCSSSSDPSLDLAAPASSSEQCQVPKHFCLCFGLKSLSLLPAVVQQPRNL